MSSLAIQANENGSESPTHNLTKCRFPDCAKSAEVLVRRCEFNFRASEGLVQVDGEYSRLCSQHRQEHSQSHGPSVTFGIDTEHHVVTGVQYLPIRAFSDESAFRRFSW